MLGWKSSRPAGPPLVCERCQSCLPELLLAHKSLQCAWITSALAKAVAGHRHAHGFVKGAEAILRALTAQLQASRRICSRACSDSWQPWKPNMHKGPI